MNENEQAVRDSMSFVEQSRPDLIIEKMKQQIGLTPKVKPLPTDVNSVARRKILKINDILDYIAQNYALEKNLLVSNMIVKFEIKAGEARAFYKEYKNRVVGERHKHAKKGGIK